jgi:DNA-binding response OmpR family regulator
MSKRKFKVLVIDDEAIVTSGLERALRDDYDVLIASDPVTGLATARATRPAVILCDAMLPQMSGSKVIAALRQDAVTSKIPIVLMSGYLFSTEDIGAVAFIQKPFSLPEIFAAVRLAIRNSRRASWRTRSNKRPD